MNPSSYSVIFNEKHSPSKILLQKSHKGHELPNELSQLAGSQQIFQTNNLDTDEPKNLIVIVCQEKSIAPYEWVALEDLEKLPEDQGFYLCQAIALLWPGMPHSFANNDDDLRPPSFVYKVQSDDVAFFGGSFNPWHDGHTACLELAPTENIIIVPDYNPWKSKDHQNTCRWSSLRELALKFQKTSFSIYPGFWGIKTPNPTFKWMREVSYSHKSLIIGDDNFTSFEKWSKVEDLVNILEHIYVIPRLMNMDEIKEKKQELEHHFKCKKFSIMSEHEFQHVSSTQIRKKLYQQ